MRRALAAAGVVLMCAGSSVSIASAASYWHDAYFCPICDKWIEKSCGDPVCSYGPGRRRSHLSGTTQNVITGLMATKRNDGWNRSR